LPRFEDAVQMMEKRVPLKAVKPDDLSIEKVLEEFRKQKAAMKKGENA